MRIKMPAVRIAQGMEGATEDDELKTYCEKIQKLDVSSTKIEADASDASDAVVTPSQPDILTCGVCQKPFALGDIIKFIQHKMAACNKENYLAPFGDGDAVRHHDGSESDDQNGLPLGVVNARRPSISAPINSKKSLVPSSTSSAVRILCTPPSSLLDSDDPRCSTPIKRRNRSSSPLMRPSSLPAMSNHLGLLGDDDDVRPLTRINIGRESAESSPDEARRSKLARIDVADAESNTINSEPNNYVCSTCKQRLHSAWRLVQHVQNSHGMKIYVESAGADRADGAKKDNNNRSSSSNCSSSSACSSGSLPGPGTPLSLPPPSSRLHPHPPPSSPLLDPLHHPFPVGGLLRHPFPPTSMSSPLGLGPLFPRPSSHDHFRMEQLVSEQFRLSQQGLGLAANAASIAPPPPVSPFGPTSTSVAPTSTPSRPSTGAPPAPLNLEPQLDFYSQRLRQLAGATSPGAASAANGSSPSPSPRQGLLTPPFSSSSTPGAAPAAATPLSLNNSKDSNNSNSTSSSSSTAANNNNNHSAVNNNNSSNNNNTSLLNNNTSGDSDSESITRPPRPQSLTSPEKQSQMAETPSNPAVAVAVTSTPRSASTPPDGDLDGDKPTDFSRTAKSMTGLDDDGERIHGCEFCGKKFRFQSSLIAHRRVHTGEKPYKCSVCDHACAQHSKLKRHMKIHRLGRDAANGSEHSADQMSNAGSVETLEDDDEDEDEEEEEEEEEDEDEEEDMELEDEDADDDDDLGGDAPEDLTTKSNSSTPPNNNNTNLGSDKNTGSPRPTPSSTPMDKVATGSLVGELMDKFGLNHIAQYSEAYKQALQESVIGPNHLGLKDDLLHRSPLSLGDNNNISKLSRSSSLENGLLEKSAAALRFREEFAKNMLAAGQPPLDLVGGPHGIFGPGAPFDNPFDTASKRLKLDLEHGNPLGRPGDRADLYAGLWLPTSAHHLFPGADGSMDLLGSRGKSDLLKCSNGPKAGPSASSLAAAAAAALNLGLPVSAQQLKKEGRRNDTCEFCGKVFKNCSNLTVHRRSHTGEKPYKCELCPYACAQSSKLTRHMKTHGRLGKDVYRCRFCEMPFSVPSTLEKHMRKCVVNQNAKGGHHFLSMSGDEDSSLSAAKEPQWEQGSQIDVEMT